MHFFEVFADIKQFTIAMLVILKIFSARIVSATSKVANHFYLARNKIFKTTTTKAAAKDRENEIKSELFYLNTLCEACIVDCSPP